MSRLRFFAALVLLSDAALSDPRIAFDTRGGDAWTFDVQISGRAPREYCDAVSVQSPLGRLQAVQIADRFHIHVPLQSGENALQAICRKNGRETAHSESVLWRVQLPDLPKAWIRLRVADNSISLDATGSETARARPAPIVEYQWRARAGNPAPLRLTQGGTLDTHAATRAEALSLAVPERDGEYYVVLQVADATGRTDQSTHVFRVVAGRPREVDLRTEHPAWVDEAILYGAAPYFFQPGNFRGISERLEEIAALGATAIWLSPITAAATGDFGYAVTDQFALREQFGTERELRALIGEAHRLGLRVVLDFVPNHLSEQSTYYQDAARHGARSAYYRWFDRDTAGEVTSYFDWEHLKNLDYDNPQVRAYTVAAFARWVRSFDIDGFRVDASWAIALRAPEFWPQLRAELKRIDPDILLLAEASAREPHPFAHGFDAAYDWTSSVGEWAWRDAFLDDGSVNVQQLRAALTDDGDNLPADALVLRFLNNNDSGERFVTRFGRPLAKLAATMLFTLPGLPLIYNGDEAGAAFEPYDEGPPIRWDDGGELAAHYRQLTKLRQQTSALRTREMELLHTDQDASVLAFRRPAAASDVLVLLNFSPRRAIVRPKDDSARQAFGEFSRAKDLLTGARVRHSRARIALEPMSAWVLTNDSSE